MARYDYLIVGGGVAGVTAAETIREREAQSSIGILSEEPHLFYSPVLLPAYLKNRIPREKLFLRTAENFSAKQIDLRLEEEVVGVRPDAHEVVLANHVVISYGKLLIASGGKIREWGDFRTREGTHRLQTLDDADRLMARLPLTRAPLVIGSSFIALEFVEIFLVHKIRPTVLVRNSHFFGGILDAAGGKMLQENFAAFGVTPYFHDTVSKVELEEGMYRVETAGGEKIHADMVSLGVGIERNTNFLKGSGVALGEGVRTNEFLETDQEGIYAAGDVAEFYDVVFQKYRVVGNWTNAFLQGKRAGLNMAGVREPFRNVSGYSITNLGLQITVLGDCTEADEALTRIWQEGKTRYYERFFLRQGVLTGAALINRFPDKSHLSELILHRTSVEKYRMALEDSAFDIHEIPIVP